MNPALLTLIRLQSRGFLRRLARSTQSRTRAAFLAIGLIVIVIWLGSSLAMSVAGRHIVNKGDAMVASEQTVLSSKQLDLLSINTIRTLAIDAVQQANSGHPGAPMALAPVAYTCLLYTSDAADE